MTILNCDGKSREDSFEVAVASSSTMTLYLLFESASGFALFERVKSDEIGIELPDVQKAVQDVSRFSKIMKLKGTPPPPPSRPRLLRAHECLSHSLPLPCPHEHQERQVYEVYVFPWSFLVSMSLGILHTPSCVHTCLLPSSATYLCSVVYPLSLCLCVCVPFVHRRHLLQLFNRFRLRKTRWSPSMPSRKEK